MTTWLTLILGGIILVVGLIGQFFFLRLSKLPPAHPHDKRIGKIVITIGSAVVGAWLVIFSAAHLLHNAGH